MKMLRIDAGLVVNASVVRDRRLCILCGVGEDLRVLKGPWYGHEYVEKVTYPFMLSVLNQVFWGYEDHQTEKTNINLKELRVGEQITLFGDPTGRDSDWAERVFRIIEVNEIR
jgi:hypothetical protein